MLARFYTLLLLSILAITSSGCMLATPGLGNQRTALEAEIPGAKFDRTFGIRLGRMSLGLTRSIIRASEDEDEDVDAAVEALRHVKGVQVAVYETLELPSVGTAAFKPPSTKDLDGNWFVAANIRGQDHAGWALARTSKKGLVREIRIGVLDEDQLVLVRIKGNLEALLEQLEESNELDLPGLIHTDLDPAEGEPVATLESEL